MAPPLSLLVLLGGDHPALVSSQPGRARILVRVSTRATLPVRHAVPCSVRYLVRTFRDLHKVMGSAGGILRNFGGTKRRIRNRGRDNPMDLFKGSRKLTVVDQYHRPNLGVHPCSQTAFPKPCSFTPLPTAYLNSTKLRVNSKSGRTQ